MILPATNRAYCEEMLSEWAMLERSMTRYQAWLARATGMMEMAASTASSLSFSEGRKAVKGLRITASSRMI
ncbi:hypothetical protein D3C81_2224390 [compost metagenome]